MGVERRAGYRAIVAVIVAATAGRVALAFATYGVAYDMHSWRIVADALRDPAATVYSTGRYPYPPAFLPVVWLCDTFARGTGLPLDGVIQLPAILADAALAWLAFVFVGGRAALVIALGPIFILISGYHGQFDSVAILPAAVGVVLWVRNVPRRALWAGLLIGLGAALKSVPLFCLLAVLPTARGRREALTVTVAAFAVPLCALAPFLIGDRANTIDALTSNKGVPGFGGLSALLQPSLTRFWVTLDGPIHVSRAVLDVTRAQNLLVGVAVLAAGALLSRRRTPPLAAAVTIWLTVWAVNPNFAYQYLVWGLPFLVLAGELRGAAGLQAAAIVPAVLLYFRPGLPGEDWLYWVLIETVWVAIVIAWLARIAPAPRLAPLRRRPMRRTA